MARAAYHLTSKQLCQQREATGSVVSFFWGGIGRSPCDHGCGRGVAHGRQAPSRSLLLSARRVGRFEVGAHG